MLTKSSPAGALFAMSQLTLMSLLGQTGQDHGAQRERDWVSFVLCLFKNPITFKEKYKNGEGGRIFFPGNEGKLGAGDKLLDLCMCCECTHVAAVRGYFPG